MSSSIISTTLPSIHDRTPLSVHLHLPSFSQSSQPTILPTNLAILAHPYATLGGNQLDPILAHLTRILLRRGYIVATFDFRGAGKSGGKTSWCAGLEEKDYETVVAWLTWYALARARCGRRKQEEIIAEDDGERERVRMRVIIGGYSYGSMIASRMKPAQEIYDIFVSSKSADIAASAEGFATEHAGLQLMPELKQHQQQLNLPSSSSPLSPVIQTSYLLVSPLLPPLTTLLSLSPLSLWPRRTQDQQHKSLTQHPTLAVFGTNDVFTSSSKLRTWSEKLAAVVGSQFMCQVVKGAGHFWQEDGVLEEMLRKVDEWLDDGALQ